VERGASPHTLRSYRTDLTDCAAFLDRRRLGPLVGADARALRAYLADLHERGLARTSVARHLAALRSFYTFRVRRARARANPAREPAGPNLPKQLPGYLPIDESQALLRADGSATATATRDRAVIELLYATGIRVAELAGLSVEDVDLREGAVRVLGKGSKERIVPMGRPAVEALRLYLGGRAVGPLLLNERGGRPPVPRPPRSVRA